jgi:hypothetical protein
MAPIPRAGQRSAARPHRTRDTAIFYAIPIAVLALVIWWRNREASAQAAGGDDAPVAGGTATLIRRRTYLAPLSTRVTTVVTVLAIVAAGAGLYGIYRIGESGSRAAWTGNVSQTATDRGPGGRDHD